MTSDIWAVTAGGSVERRIGEVQSLRDEEEVSDSGKRGLSFTTSLEVAPGEHYLIREEHSRTGTFIEILKAASEETGNRVIAVREREGSFDTE